ncbi:MAG: FecR domain-containing protein [Emergencia sp.]
MIACCAVLLLTMGVLTACGGSSGDGPGSGSVSSGGSEGGKAGESARTVVVDGVNGTAVVLDESKESMNAYKGMNLYSGNDVTVQKSSDMTLVLDMDKYLYAEPESHFWLEASGSSDSSKTVIYLDEGAEVNRIKNPLEEGSVYQVDTPNSTMAVRGTVFRVVVRRGEDGEYYTYLEVFDGSVRVKLKNTKGEYNGVTETFTAGEAAAIRGNTDISEFITDGDGEAATTIDYATLPAYTADQLIYYLDDGETLSVDRETLEEVAELNRSDDDPGQPGYTGNPGNPGNGENPSDTGNPGNGQNPGQAGNPGNGQNPGQNGNTAQGNNPGNGGNAQNGAGNTGQTGGTLTNGNANTPAGTAGSQAHTHKWKSETVRKATCTQTGIVQSVCSVCGQTKNRKETAKKDHTEAASWKTASAATCTEAGSETKSCTVCGKVMRTRKIDPTGHMAGKGEIVEAACTQEGSETVKCMNCGEILEQTIIEAPGHKPGDWVTTKYPDYGIEGEKTQSCTVCGEVVNTQTIPALVWVEPSCEHKETTKENVSATCVEYGKIVTKCSSCGEILSTETAAEPTGHTEAEVEGKEATCTEAGLTAGVKCSVCGEIIVAQEEIPATGHKEIVPLEAIAPTCTETGLTEGSKCETCGEKLVEQKEIPATGHTEETIPGKTATCTEAGSTDGVKCSVCGEILVEQKAISATGHTEVTIPGKEPTDTETGLTDGVKCSVCGEILQAQEIIPAKNDMTSTYPTDQVLQ